MDQRECGNGFCHLSGADIELGNFVVGRSTWDGSSPRESCREASAAILREIDGVDAYGSWGRQSDGEDSIPRADAADGNPAWHSDGASPPGEPDCTTRSPASERLHKYLPENGGLVYIDLDHVEMCLPEVRSAFDHVAAFHAMLRIVNQARVRAQVKLPSGQKLVVLANNSDGLGSSYGSHFNFLISRRCFDNIFHRKLHHMLYLASYFVSSICFTGAGKAGTPENGREPVDYQVAQRADFLETLTGTQTTYRRPIINSRDENHAAPDLARLHVIFWDNGLCHISHLLKVGVTQIVLAMLEQECVSTSVLLDDPLVALQQWSHDPMLRRKAHVVSGDRYTAVEAQLKIFEEAHRFVSAGRADGIVPRVHDIMRVWQDVLLNLEARNFSALARQLDWVLKWQLLQGVMGERAELTWSSREIKHLDHLYSSIEPQEGLYWAYERAGSTDQIVSEAEIGRLMGEPPEDTRAWLRAQILRRADPWTIESIDWSVIRLRFRNPGAWPLSRYYTVKMDDPLRFTKAECEHIFERAASLEDALKTLEMETRR